MPLDDAKPWHNRSSPLARQACLAYAALLVVASLYPLASWRDAGVAPWAYWFAPWPRWITAFDVVTNVVAYLPFGALAVLGLHPRRRGLLAVVIAALAGIVLSGCLEALQTYLPNRIASNVDLGLNAIGSVLGAMLTAPFASAVIDRGPMLHLRLRWFEHDASRGLLLVGLWLAAQLAALPILFGFGEVVGPALAMFAEFTGAPIDPPAWIAFTPEEMVANEALIAGAALAGVALLMLQLVRPQAPRFRLVLLLVVAAILARSFASAVILSIDEAFIWLTPGAQLGLLIGSMIALAAAYAPARVRRGFAIALIAGATLAINLAPADPYFTATMSSRHQGPWINFAGLVRALAIAWPYLALIFLLSRRAKPLSMKNASI